MCPPFTANGDCDVTFANASAELYSNCRLLLLALSSFLLAVAFVTSCYVTGGRLKHSFRTVSGKIHCMGVLVGLTLVARSIDPWSFRGLYPYAAYLALQGLSAASMLCVAAEITLSWKQAHAKFQPAAPMKERRFARRIRVADWYLFVVLPGLGVLMGLGRWLTRVQWWMIFQGHIVVTSLVFIAWSLKVSIPLYIALINHEIDLFSRTVVPPEKKRDSVSSKKRFPKRIEQAKTLPLSPTKSSRKRRGGLTDDLFEMPSDSSSSSGGKFSKRTKSTGDLTSETLGFAVAGDTLASFDLGAAAKSSSQSATEDLSKDVREINRERSRRPSRVVQEEMARAAAYLSRHKFRMSRYRRILYTSFLLSLFGIVSIGMSALNFYRIFTVPERLETPPSNVMELLINGYAFFTSEVLEVAFVLACLWFWRTKISLPNRRFRQKYHNRAPHKPESANQKGAKDDKGRRKSVDSSKEAGKVDVRVAEDGHPFNGPRRLSLFGQTTWSISSAVSSVGDRIRRYSVSTSRHSGNWPSLAQRDPSLDALSEEDLTNLNSLHGRSSIYSAGRDDASSRTSATRASMYDALEAQTHSNECAVEMTPFAETKHGNIDSSPSVSRIVPSTSSQKVNANTGASHRKEKSISTTPSRRREAVRKRLKQLKNFSDESIEMALDQYDDFERCYGFLLMLDQRKFEKAIRHSKSEDPRRKSAAETESRHPPRVSVNNPTGMLSSKDGRNMRTNQESRSASPDGSPMSREDGDHVAAKPAPAKHEPYLPPPAAPSSFPRYSTSSKNHGVELSELKHESNDHVPLTSPMYNKIRSSSLHVPKSRRRKGSPLLLKLSAQPSRSRSSRNLLERQPKSARTSPEQSVKHAGEQSVKHAGEQSVEHAVEQSVKHATEQSAKRTELSNDRETETVDSRRDQIVQLVSGGKVPLAMPIRSDTMSSVSTASSDVGPLPHELGVSFSNRRGPRQVAHSSSTRGTRNRRSSGGTDGRGRRSSGIFDDLIREKKQKQLARSALSLSVAPPVGVPPSSRTSQKQASASSRAAIPPSAHISSDGPMRPQPELPIAAVSKPSFQLFATPSPSSKGPPSVRVSDSAGCDAPRIRTNAVAIPEQTKNVSLPRPVPPPRADSTNSHEQPQHNHDVSHENPFYSPINEALQSQTSLGKTSTAFIKFPNASPCHLQTTAADEFAIPHPSQPNNFGNLHRRDLIHKLSSSRDSIGSLYSNEQLHQFGSQSAARMHSIHGFTPTTDSVCPSSPTTRSTPLRPDYSRQFQMHPNLQNKRGSASTSKSSLSDPPNFQRKRNSGSASKSRRRASFSFSHVGSLSATASARHRRSSSTAILAAMVADDFAAELSGDSDSRPPTPTAPRTRAPMPFTPPHLPPLPSAAP